MRAPAKGHAALPPDAGYSISRAAVASVRRFKSMVMERASDVSFEQLRARHAPCTLRWREDPCFREQALLVTVGSEGSVQRLKKRIWWSGAGVVGRWPEVARSRERAVVEQRVEADEAGASDGASPLNPVFYGP